MGIWETEKAFGAWVPTYTGKDDVMIGPMINTGYSGRGVEEAEKFIKKIGSMLDAMRKEYESRLSNRIKNQ